MTYNYVRHVLFERGVKQILPTRMDTLHDFLHVYGLGPIVVMHLDHLVQDKSVGLHDFQMCYGIYTSVTDICALVNLDLPRLVNEALGLDVEAEYAKVLGIYDFSKMKQFVDLKHGLYVYRLLDYLRDTEAAPPILYYIYLELESKLGNPEDAMCYSRILPGTFYATRLLDELVMEFRQNYPLMEAKLIGYSTRTRTTRRAILHVLSSKVPSAPTHRRSQCLDKWQLLQCRKKVCIPGKVTGEMW